MIIGEEGIVTSSHFMRLPEQQMWSIDTLEKIQVLPWDVAKRFGSAKLDMGEKIEAPVAETAARVARRLYIMPWMLAKFGYTADCPQCRHTSVHGSSKAGVTRSDTCRGRVIKSLKESEDQKDKDVVSRFHHKAAVERERLLDHRANRPEPELGDQRGLPKTGPNS